MADLTSTVPGGAPAPADPIRPGLRARLSSLQGHETLRLPVGEIRDLVAALDAARVRLPASEPLEWKTSVPSPYPYSDAPVAVRIVACTHDIDASQVDRTDGCYTDVVGLLAEHDHATDVAAANAMGLAGDWDTDDVNEAVTNALHEYRGHRAALDSARADVERLRRELVAAETAREHYASAVGVLAAERDEARSEVERLREECNATAESAIETAGQRIAALAVCRDLEREAEHLRGQAGRVAWEKAQAVSGALTRIRKALGEETRRG